MEIVSYVLKSSYSSLSVSNLVALGRNALDQPKIYVLYSPDRTLMFRSNDPVFRGTMWFRWKSTYSGT